MSPATSSARVARAHGVEGDGESRVPRPASAPATEPILRPTGAIRPANASPPPDRGRHRCPVDPDRANMPLLWLGQVVNTTGLMMLVPIMPFYVQQLGVEGTVAVQSWAGVAIAAPALALTVATPLWGKVGDRIGRKWMVVRALVGLALAMTVMAFATGPVMLIAGRLLQGTLGGVVEAAAAFAGATGPRGKRGSALGKSFSATATGSLIGPIAGGALIGSSALVALMLSIAALAAVAAVACALGLREPSEEMPDAESSENEGPRASVFRWRDVPHAWPLAAGAAAAYFGIYGLIPIFAERVQSLEPVDAGPWVGTLQAITWGATLCSSAWWGRRNDRLGRPLNAFGLAAAGCAIAVVGQAFVSDPIALIPLRLVQGLCFAALAQSLFLHVGNHAPSSRRSGIVGSANSFLLAGQSAGPLLAGPFLAVLDVRVVIGLMGLACGVAAALALRSSRTSGAQRASLHSPMRGPFPRSPTGRRLLLAEDGKR